MHFGGPWLPWPPLDMVTWRMQIYTIINLTFLIVLQLLFRFLLLILFPFWNFLFSLIVITSFLVRLMCVLTAPIKVVVYFNRFSQYLSICFLWKPHTNRTKRKKKKTKYWIQTNLLLKTYDFSVELFKSIPMCYLCYMLFFLTKLFEYLSLSYRFVSFHCVPLRCVPKLATSWKEINRYLFVSVTFHNLLKYFTIYQSLTLST